MVLGRLDELAVLARRQQVASPALLILGDVAALAGQLHWFGAAPWAMHPHFPQRPAPPHWRTPPDRLPGDIRMALYDSILDTVGRTPIVKLNRIAPDHVTLYAKVESFNPGGSVKDRLALAIVLDAEQRGLLKPGDTIVEATSGNTGVALAMVAAARGYKFVATMVETFSIERRKLMRAYGAR